LTHPVDNKFRTERCTNCSKTRRSRSRRSSRSRKSKSKDKKKKANTTRGEVIHDTKDMR